MARGQSFGSTLDKVAAAVLPLETAGSHFAEPADDNPRVNHPAPFAKTSRDEVRPKPAPTTVPTRTVARRTTRSRR